jgi:threonine/homoserine/homoserine lactone efflux protein
VLGTHDLALFIVSGLLLNLAPGPDTLYIVGRSSTQGYRAGAAAALGIFAGTFVHIAAAAGGLSALLAASASAFTVVKIAGAIYLAYIGISLLRSPVQSGATGPGLAPASLHQVFVQGFFTNVLNPKVALFFLAFLPQFVDPARGAVAAQILVLGLLFIALGICTDGAWAIGAGTARQWLGARPRNTAGQRYVVGGVYVGLGLVAAFSSASRTK